MLESALFALALQCAPQVTPTLVMRVIAVEAQPAAQGGYNPNSLNINGTNRRIVPRSRAAAIALAKKYVHAGRSVDMGLMQINSQHLAPRGLSIEDIFDPCVNIRVGGEILTEFYLSTPRTAPTQTRLLQMLSAYNTGNFSAGFRNGYVRRYFSP